MLGGSLTRASPAPVAAAEAQAWAWAGFNLLTLGAPTAAELRNYSGAAAALGAWLDGGYSFGYFVAAEPRSPAAEADGGAEARVAEARGAAARGGEAGGGEAGGGPPGGGAAGGSPTAAAAPGTAIGAAAWAARKSTTSLAT